MRKPIILLLGVFTILVSCTDRGRLERREDRIEGQWYFDRAFYKGDLALFRKNIVDDYKGDEITFYDDGFAEYYDASLNAYFEGDWFLTLHKTRTNEGNERLYTLDMEFVDHIHRERFSFYSNATRIGFNNLNLEVYDDSGFYTFKLNKLD
jgi:hypothetical protein